MRKGKQKSESQEHAKSQEKPKRKKKRRVRKLLFLMVIGGTGALALSEDLRNKALDALFGSEEEFQYSPPSTTPPSTTPPTTTPPSTTPADGAGNES